ncbi:hypothetical protein GLOIN_2v1135001 [Rhizophagus irregularis DAOM 181602=DAOM 197198]|uniref:Uncharacterized protein n=1 Tax=Rhizophagus irregularis (strain DAOM 181602 / DAOM 197198 / MUCL 43194) TaxID=747089 RepID=A0A2P4Q5V4_RHIID|nr:hypothetical protein GLOIN_2v1135001 [Rhizophagus irregularis DAOM 181602=DAOM 197198]POG73004.1 hypothetical protein GLOIN_2v1135001 [Rhizophagus irregularis DAOM 181602=DAOM 197198]|eukprot:XP_025179870.1 hypothetical protein GLOIN_2v1135001 [Rhizophagus irregularis DAOM 181602=DAOM 197198]
MILVFPLILMILINQAIRVIVIHSIFKANSKNLSETFEKLQINDETVQKTKGSIVIYNDEINNNPNLHSEEQDELEIPNGKKFIILKNAGIAKYHGGFIM